MPSQSLVLLCAKGFSLRGVMIDIFRPSYRPDGALGRKHASSYFSPRVSVALMHVCMLLLHGCLESQGV